MVLWIVSVPYEDTREKTFKRIHQKLTKQVKCDCFLFKILKLRHGTLDNLMTLSDELSKRDSQVEQITNKILNTLISVGEVKRNDFIAEVLSDDNTAIPAFEYLKHFKWDESQYLNTTKLTDIISKIVKKVEKFDEVIRNKDGEYGNLKHIIDSLERKNEGNLLVKGLDGIIKKEHIVESEYLTTMFVVVPRSRKKEWLKVYEDEKEMGVSFVVPDSSELISEDDEYCLFSVVLIKKMAQDYKNGCSEKKFIVRQFKYDEEKKKLSKLQKDKMLEKKENMRRQLYERCKIGFSECFSAWIHIKAIRSFVESVLRYGLPPRFVSLVINLQQKHIKKVHKFFRNQFKYLIDENLENIEKKSDVPLFASQSHAMEFHPYVLLNIAENPLIFKGKR